MGAVQDSTVHKSSYGQYRIVVDETGRKYRVGEDVKAITRKVGLGQGRNILLLGAWMSFFMGSVLEYGWSIASSTVESYFHMSFLAAFAEYSIYVLFEATLVAYTYGWMRERGLISPRRTLLLGGAMLFMSYYFLANSWQPWILWTGYSALGGFAGGFGYATGGSVVGKWFPDKRGWRTGLANGAWAYGGAPFIFVYALYLKNSTVLPLFLETGVIIGVGMIIASFLVCDPPKYWWPPHIDPIEARHGRLKSTELKKNPPAVAQWGPKEFWASTQGKALVASFTLGLTASLFAVGYYAAFGSAMGFGGLVAFAIGAAGFAATDGVGRPTMGFISNYISRKRMLALAYIIMGVGGLATLYAGLAHSPVLFAVFAIISGGVSGACFCFAWIIAGDYFGENNLAKNWGSTYVFKFVGGAAAGIGVAYMLTVTHFDWTLAFWLGAIVSVLAALIVIVFLHPPTIDEYIAVRNKLGLPIPDEIRQRSRGPAIGASESGGDRDA